MATQISNEEDGPIASINIVPFVDIILVVLIIFMVTTPFIMKPSINVNLPKAASGEESQPSTLNVTITSKGQLVLNGKSASIEEINRVSQQASASSPETQAVISADKDVRHEVVVQVIDAIKTGGVKKFAITIDKKQ